MGKSAKECLSTSIFYFSMFLCLFVSPRKIIYHVIRERGVWVLFLGALTSKKKRMKTTDRQSIYTHTHTKRVCVLPGCCFCVFWLLCCCCFFCYSVVGSLFSRHAYTQTHTHTQTDRQTDTRVLLHKTGGSDYTHKHTQTFIHTHTHTRARARYMPHFFPPFTCFSSPR